MTTEEQLREMILKRYHSMREFSARIDVPNSTVESILKRGVQNSSVSNVIKLCKGLNISVEALAEGRIEFVKPKVKPTTLKYNDKQPYLLMVNSDQKKVDIDKILGDAVKTLKKSTEVTLAGHTVKNSDVDYIIDSIDFGVSVLKKRQNKED